MTRFKSTRHRPADNDEPYHRLPRPTMNSNIPSASRRAVQSTWVGGEWFEQPRPRASRNKQCIRPQPIVIDSDEDSDCCEVPPPEMQNANVSQASHGACFDFNDTAQAVPWAQRLESVSQCKVSILSVPSNVDRKHSLCCSLAANNR